MPVKPIFDPDYFYFVTTTAVKHTHLFRQDFIKRIIVDSLQHLRTIRQMKLFVFVIMPNHIHVIAQFSEDNTLSDVMRDFKKFTARRIYCQFSAEGHNRVLSLYQQEGRNIFGTIDTETPRTRHLPRQMALGRSKRNVYIPFIMMFALGS